VPSCRMMWLRAMPSFMALMRSMASMEAKLRWSILNCTRMAPSSPKAWRSIRNLLSRLMPSRWKSSPIQVPISTTRFSGWISMKRVVPQALPLRRSMIANGRSVPSSRRCSSSSTSPCMPCSR